jgi:hypothetical protein
VTPASVPVSPAVTGPQPTGPVDFVPGLPGVGTPPPPPPAAIPSITPSTAPPTTPATAPAGAQPTEGPGWPDTLDAEQRPSARQKARVPVGRPALIGMILALVALVLLELGLLLRFSSVSYWSAVALWSAFATLAALVGLVAVVAGAAPGSRLRPGTAWRIAAGGFAGLAVFWVLVVLPNVASDRGFVLTAALGCLGGAVWVAARRSA